jgi:two-component system, chemotaxis family, CheB/CheR fusion protein
LFELTPDDWNRPFQELEPGKLLGSQAFMANFYRHHHPITLKNVEWSNAETIKYFDIAIAPVYSSRKQLLGIILTFLDQTNYQKLIKELKGTNTELHKVSEAYQETYIELEAAYQEIDLLTQNTSES